MPSRNEDLILKEQHHDSQEDDISTTHLTQEKEDKVGSFGVMSYPGSGGSTISGGGTSSVSSKPFSLRPSCQMKREMKDLILEDATKRTSEELSKARMRDLTINKLDFEHLGLQGRWEEEALLKKCLDRLARANSATDADLTTDIGPNNKTSKELVLIHGVSGTGKTTLAATLQDSVRQRKGLYVRGKFDLFHRDQPYAGIAAACRAIIGELLLLKNGGTKIEIFQKVQQKIQDEFRESDFILLKRIVPEFGEIWHPVHNQLANSTTELEATNQSPSNSQEIGNQDALNYAFRRFFRIACSSFAPLVVLLDDLQWSDPASLDLLQTLLSDMENNNLMIIGCYRSDEVPEGGLLSKALLDLKSKSGMSQYNMQLTDIPLDKLSVASVDKILQNLLSMEVQPSGGAKSPTWALAELCHKRTHGNPLFVLAFIEMLQDEGLLSFNLGIFRWTWDLQRITEKTAACPNVVDMVQSKMNRKMPKNVIQLLQMAACLGSSFDQTTLAFVWKSHPSSEDSSTMPEGHVHDMLAGVAEQEGFLENDGKGRYRWVHDKIRESAMALIPEDNREAFKFRVGEILLAQLNADQIGTHIFVVANLLNSLSADPLSETQSLNIARLNLDAANKAALASAFHSAAMYASKGIALLKATGSVQSMWTCKDRYKLILDLYSVGAEAEFIVGGAGSSEKYCKTVLNHKKYLSTHDLLRVYNVQADRMANIGQLEEAMKLYSDVLEELGCKFPASPIARVVRVLRDIKAINNVPDKDTISKLPFVSDRDRAACMKLLSKLAIFCYLTQSESLFVIVATRAVRWTLRYGICPESPAFFGMCGSLTSDMKKGSAYGEHGMALADRIGEPASECVALFHGYASNLSWTSPLRTTAQMLHKAYKDGMVTGLTEEGMYSLQLHLSSAMMSGRSLLLLEEDCKTYIPQMDELRKEESAQCVRALLELIQSLARGGEESSNGITGSDAMYILKANALEQEWSSYTQVCIGVYRIMECAYLGDYETGAEFALQKGDKFQQAAPGNFMFMVDVFARAICLSAAARARKGRSPKKYKQEAKRLTKKMMTWLKEGAINVHHQMVLLQAEQAALCGKNNEASKFYHESIVLSSRNGAVHDAALANERYGDFLLNNMDDKEGATFQMDEAIRSFGEWGAHWKVKRLRSVYKELWPVPGHIDAIVSEDLDTSNLDL